MKKAIVFLSFIMIIPLCLSGCLDDTDGGIISDETGINSSTDEEALPEQTTTAEPLESTGESSIVTTAPPETIHIHDFSDATCTSPKTCSSCGVTEGMTLDHDWAGATCTSPKTCSSCGVTEGTAFEHSFSNGHCNSCGEADPNYVNDSLVWIPTKGGKKYHSNSKCSNMIDPEQVSRSYAISQGFDACKRCH